MWSFVKKFLANILICGEAAVSVFLCLLAAAFILCVIVFVVLGLLYVFTTCFGDVWGTVITIICLFLIVVLLYTIDNR